MNRKLALSIVGTFVIGVVGGASLMLNDSAYRSVKGAVTGEATMNSIGGIGSMDISQMDIESALQMVQSQRANLLEEQLKTQIQQVQDRNADIAKFNDLMSILNEALAGIPANASATATYELPAEKRKKLTEVGILDSSKEKYTKKELEAGINKIKTKVDELGNSQQMDMLKLQSLTNKRNEAFDLMTNFIKKMQDSRSSIIGNMR